MKLDSEIEKGKSNQFEVMVKQRIDHLKTEAIKRGDFAAGSSGAPQRGGEVPGGERAVWRLRRRSGGGASITISGVHVDLGVGEAE